jgi:integrase
MKGTVFKRCGCTDLVDGRRKQLGHKCPKLRRSDGTWNPRHGSWTYAVSVPGKDGKRQQVVRGGFDSQVEAQRELDASRDRVRRGVSVDQLSVRVFLTEWLASKADIRRSTFRGYRIHLQTHCIPALGHLQMSERRVAHVAAMLAEVPGSDANRQRVRATLRSALSDAVRQGIVLMNVASLVKLPSGKRPKAQVWTNERVERWRDAVAKVEDAHSARANPALLAVLELETLPPSKVMVWTPQQIGTFLDSAIGDSLYPLLHTVAHCGLRRGEACGLRWIDLDLDAATLTVAKELVQDGWDVYEDDPKSDAGGRTIHLDRETVKVLREHRHTQRENRLVWGPAWIDSGRVFTQEDGQRLHPASVTTRFNALLKYADLPPVTLHGLRHGAASLMLAAGVDMKVVQEILGHSMLSLTADTYTSVYPEVAAAAAEAAAALVPRSIRARRIPSADAR